MANDLEKQILNSLRSLTSADRPATFNHLARQFGTTAPLISSLAHQMVEKGLAQPSYVDIKGVPTMFGLMPQPATAKPAAAKPVVPKTAVSPTVAGETSAAVGGVEPTPA